MMADFQGLFQLSTACLKTLLLCKTYEAKQQRKLNKNQRLNVYKLWATDDQSRNVLKEHQKTSQCQTIILR